MKLDRINQVENYIRIKKIVTITELSQHFNVSINTIRRDLKILKAEKKIDTVYGGAKTLDLSSSESDLLQTYAERNVKNSVQKNIVARYAANFVNENDIIFIDTGTSTVPLIRYLSSLQHITVVTNSVYVLYSCIEFPHITTIGLPGILKHKTASLVGEQCEKMLKLYNINKAFMACTGFTLEGANNSSLEEYTIKKTVLDKSSKKYLLIDHSKFDTSSLLTFAAPEDFDTIITDQSPSEKYTSYFTSHKIELIIAK